MKKFIILLLITIMCGTWGMNPLMRKSVLAQADDVPKEVGEESGESGVEEFVPLYIKAVNPGYTVDGVKNVGEMIEIGKRKADEMMLLAGITISYTNTSGNKTMIVEFPEQSYFTGENIVMRLASAPESELANLNYKTQLAVSAGAVEIKRGDEVLDSVCWGTKGCYKFDSAKPTTLVRAGETFEFEHREGYEPKYLAENYVIMGTEDDGGKGEVAARCRGMMFSEILSYYAEIQAEQFIELYNPTAETIALDGCYLRYKNKDYVISGMVKPEGYFARYLNDFSVAKNPSNVGVVELVDANGEIVDKLEYPNGQRKGTSYAWLGYNAEGNELWRTTYAVTAGEPNVYQEYKTCEEGKVINEVTGNCVKVTEVADKICAEGQYLNLLTGRCKKIEEKTETVCRDGYELNPETGRCKKIVVNNGADYALAQETYEEGTNFVGLYAVLGVGVAALGYAIWEFRREIAKLWRKVQRGFRR